MSYLMQAKLAGDQTILARVTACAATEGVTDPQGWAYQRQWELSAQPGWVDAYASAVASGDSEPGANEAAITDGMILSAVQSIIQESP